MQLCRLEDDRLLMVVQFLPERHLLRRIGYLLVELDQSLLTERGQQLLPGGRLQPHDRLHLVIVCFFRWDCFLLLLCSLVFVGSLFLKHLPDVRLLLIIEQCVGLELVVFR